MRKSTRVAASVTEFVANERCTETVPEADIFGVCFAEVLLDGCDPNWGRLLGGGEVLIHPGLEIETLDESLAVGGLVIGDGVLVYLLVAVLPLSRDRTGG